MKNSKESFEMQLLKIGRLIARVNICMYLPKHIIQLFAKKFNKFVCVKNQFSHAQIKNIRQHYDKTRKTGKTTLIHYYSTIYYNTTYLLLNLLTYYLLNYTKKCETLVKLWLNFFENCKIVLNFLVLRGSYD